MKTKAATTETAQGSSKTDLPKGSGETDPSNSPGPDAPAHANDPGAAGAGEAAQGSPGGGRKRGGGDVDGIAIPAKALCTETAAPGEISCPELPPDDSTMDAWEVLKDYIPWVEHELAKSAVVRGSGAAKPLWQYAPLGIQVKDAGATTQSYMAPWDDGAAVTTLRDTHLYQAGGNVAWLLASVHGPVPVVRMSWQNARELKSTFFSKVPGKVRDEGRIVFPGIIGAFVKELGELAASCGKGPNEVPVLAGQGLLWAWYIAVGDALRAGDNEYLTALWQCGRSVTIHLRHEPDQACVMARATAASEALRVPAKFCSDTFLTFAAKVTGTGIPPERANIQRLKALNLTYNGAPINFTMLSAVRDTEALDADTRSIIAKIDYGFGREVFSTGYNKLSRVVQIVRKGCADLECSEGAALRFFFGASRRALVEGKAKDSSFGVPELENKGKAAGTIYGILGRLWLREHAAEIVADLRAKTGASPVVPRVRKSPLVVYGLRILRAGVPPRRHGRRGESRARASRWGRRGRPGRRGQGRGRGRGPLGRAQKDA